MLGFYNVSVILTYISLACAVCGMRLAIGANTSAAVVCLMVCGLCDMFDGKIARATKRSEDACVFGIQIDSLCDLVCFGALPAVIAMTLGVTGVLGTAVLALYVLAAVIRLGYFNVVEQKRQQQTSENRKSYQGMPVTTAAWLVPAFYAAGSYFFPDRLPAGLTVWMFLIAVAFVANFRIPKPQQLLLYAAAGVTLAAAAAAVLLWL